MGSGGLLAKTVLLIACLGCGSLGHARNFRRAAAQAYWPGEIRRWSNEVATQSAPTAEIRDAVVGIVGDAATAQEKARRLYAAVQGLYVLDLGQEETALHEPMRFAAEPRKPQDVWRQKTGSANEIAMLYLALSAAAGLDAYGMQVADRARRVFDPHLLSFEQLDAFLVGIRVEGKDFYLDPGEKMCPFGQLAWNHRLAGGVSQKSDQPIQTPAGSVEDALTARVAELSIDPEGNISGTVKVIMKGPQALYWRQRSLVMNREENQRTFARQLQDRLPPGIRVESAEFKGLEDPDTYLKVTASIRGTLGDRTRNRLILPACLFPPDTGSDFAAEHHHAAANPGYPEQVIDELRLRIPAGYSVENLPMGIRFAWPEHAALSVRTSSGAGSLNVRQVFARSFVALDAKDCATMRDFYKKLAAADERHVVLVSSTQM